MTVHASTVVRERERRARSGVAVASLVVTLATGLGLLFRQTGRAWVRLAVVLALIAAAVDIVGVVVGGGETAVVFAAAEGLGVGLTNVAAFGLYSLAGLLLLPALFAERHYPRWLARLGAVEWIVAGVATLLLVAAPALATGPLLISFALFAPWVWGSAVWLLRTGGSAKT